MLMLLAIVSASVSPAQTFYSGSDLAALCGGSSAERAQCANYVAGAYDMQVTTQAVGGKALICEPENVTVQQVVDAVTVFMAAHPDYKTEGAAGLVIMGAANAFPCKQ